MKKYLITVKALFLFLVIHAQESLPLIQSNQFDNFSSSTFPSYLGGDFKVAQIELGAASSFGSDGVPFGTIRSFVLANAISTSDLENYTSSLADFNVISNRTQVMPLSVAFKLNPLPDFLDYAAFSFGEQERIASDIFFTNSAVELALNGNAQFAGQDVEVGFPGLNSNYFREFTFGMATAKSSGFSIHNLPLTIKAGFNIKYLTALAFTDVPNSEFSLFTDSLGRYIDVSLNEEFNFSGFNALTTSLPLTLPSIVTNPFDYHKQGNGWGADFGFSVGFFAHHQVDFSVTDIGSLNFNTNVNSTIVNGDYHFEGVEIENVLTGLSTDTIGSVLNNFNYESKPLESYKIALPTQLHVNYSYTFSIGDGLSPVKTNAFISLSQSLKKTSNAVSQNQVTTGCNFTFAEKYTAGASLTFGGYEKFGAGLFTSAKLGPVKIGVCTSSIVPLLSNQTKSGFTAGLLLGFSL